MSGMSGGVDALPGCCQREYEQVEAVSAPRTAGEPSLDGLRCLYGAQTDHVDALYMIEGQVECGPLQKSMAVSAVHGELAVCRQDSGPRVRRAVPVNWEPLISVQDLRGPCQRRIRGLDTSRSTADIWAYLPSRIAGIRALYSILNAAVIP